MSCLIVWCKSNKKVIVPQTFLLLSPTPVCAIVGGYGILPYPRSHQTIFPQKPTQPNHLWASVKSVGGSSLPEASVNSVNSVGEPYAPKPSVCICAICGRIIKWAAWVWQGCHTLLSVHSVGEHASPGGKTQRGHGGMPCPLTLVMWMRGYGKDAIPSYDYLTSTFLTLPSAVRTMFRPFWSLLSLTPLTVKNSTSPSATVVALIPVSGSLGAVQSLSTTLT